MTFNQYRLLDKAEIVDRDRLLQQIKNNIRQAYGDRLKGIVLYGSLARGDEDDDSDIDLLVLLTGPIELWKEIRNTNLTSLDRFMPLPSISMSMKLAILPCFVTPRRKDFV